MGRSKSDCERTEDEDDEEEEGSSCSGEPEREGGGGGERGGSGDSEESCDEDSDQCTGTESEEDEEDCTFKVCLWCLSIANTTLVFCSQLVQSASMQAVYQTLQTSLAWLIS